MEDGRYIEAVKKLELIKCWIEPGNEPGDPNDKISEIFRLADEVIELIAGRKSMESEE